MSALPPRYEHSDTAVPATLTAAMTNVDVAATGDLLTGWPTGAVGKFFVVIARGTSTEEQILVTTRSGNSLTGITRGQNGTSASAHSIGDTIEHVYTAAEADADSAHRSAATSVHGLDGAVVGTTMVQTLTNKTIDGGSNTLQNLPQASVTNLVTDLAGKAPVSRAPVGAVAGWLTAAPPTGWLLCDGQAVSRTTYAALFALLGTTYGVGDGSTTFNLPDFRGRTMLGVSASHALGSTGGAETATLAAANLPAHAHDMGGHTHDYTHGHGASASITDGAGSHQHGATYLATQNGTGSANSFVRTDGSSGTVGGSAGAPAGGHNHAVGVSVANGGGASAGPSVANTGNGPGSATPVSVLDPFLAINVIVCAL